MRRISHFRRALTVIGVVALLATSIAVIESPAGAAPIPASGTALCPVTGKVSFKPPLTSTSRATVMTVRATLGCVAAGGNPWVRVQSGKLIVTSAPFTASCQRLTFGTMFASIDWKAVGGVAVEPTVVRWAASSAAPSHLRFDLEGIGIGSFAGQLLRVHVDGDPTLGGLCGAGSKRFGFSGAGGSIMTVGGTAPRVLFEDQFNGTRLDTSKWRPNWLAGSDTASTKPVSTQEQSCYSPAQVSVGGGSLQLWASARLCPANNGITYPYAAGMVQTAKDFTFTYGRMTARIWVPPGAGPIRNWPAFWANGTGTWPTTGEINVMEGLRGRACWHFHSTSGGPGGCAALANPSGWHLFAADWRPGSVTYFYDNVQVGRITTGITGDPMYLVLNLGVSSLQSPPVTLPSVMLVDWVRVTR